MEDKIINWLKQPYIVRSVYFIGCMVGSFGLGIITHAYTINQKNSPIITIPKQPIPIAYRYKNPEIRNLYDELPAVPSITTTPDISQTIDLKGTTTIVKTESHQFIASKTGTKYYPVGCGGINRIKEENRVYFITEQEAIDKGYERTSTCQ